MTPMEALLGQNEGRSYSGHQLKPVLKTSSYSNNVVNLPVVILPASLAIRILAEIKLRDDKNLSRNINFFGKSLRLF